MRMLRPLRLAALPLAGTLVLAAFQLPPADFVRPAPTPAPAALASAPSHDDEIALRFLGRVEGSVRIELDASGARWTEVAWPTDPGAVLFAGRAWTPAREPFLANEGERAFLPADVDFASARLVRLHGRDTVAVRADEQGATLLLADTPNGSDLYEFELRLARRPRAAVLAIEARIDGSDELVIQADGAHWVHRHWGWPEGAVRMGDRLWSPTENAHLPNAGDTRFLPQGVDLSSARLLSSSGRDLVALEVGAQQLVVRFADGPPGAADYSLRIGFGPLKQR